MNIITNNAQGTVDCKSVVTRRKQKKNEKKINKKMYSIFLAILVYSIFKGT